MHRFFVDDTNISDDNIFIEGEDVKHITSVLRLNVGDAITLCDSNGFDYICEIDAINKEGVECIIKERFNSKSESPIFITLYQGIPKSTKMDLIVQKATELGVNRIVPVFTERTIVKINDKKKESKKLDRWNKIAKEAAKQSKRGKIPLVDDIVDFQSMINELKDEKFTIVPYEDEKSQSAKNIFKAFDGNRVNIIIGPEGGFEESEIQELKEIGANSISLGNRILRTETAGFTTIVLVQYELGDLGVI